MTLVLELGDGVPVPGEILVELVYELVLLDHGNLRVEKAKCTLLQTQVIHAFIDTIIIIASMPAFITRLV